MPVIQLSDHREPVSYTVHVTHHWDDRVEIWLEGVAQDQRSREAVAHALRSAAVLAGNPEAEITEWA